MPNRWALILASLGALTDPALAEPLEPPTAKTTIQIEHEIGGGCSELRAGKPGVQPAMKMTAVCHGWSSTSCADMVLIVGTGVTEDQAQVLFTSQNRAADLVGLVDQGIGARWPGHTHLHLQFGRPSCAAGALTLPVSGSHLKTGETGSAAGFHGVLRIAGPNRRRVSLQAEN